MPEYVQFLWTPPAKLERQASDDDLWRRYLNTEVHLQASDRCGTVRPLTAGMGGVNPPLGALHVITAVQPGADPLSADSLARLRVLEGGLRACGLTSIRAIGASLDSGHWEEGRAVFGLDDGKARRLGLRFGQVAVFSWCGPAWSLLACATDRHERRPWRWTDDADQPGPDRSR